MRGAGRDRRGHGVQIDDGVKGGELLAKVFEVRGHAAVSGVDEVSTPRNRDLGRLVDDERGVSRIIDASGS